MTCERMLNNSMSCVISPVEYGTHNLWKSTVVWDKGHGY